MTRELPAGLQHNLYVDRDTLPAWRAMCQYADSHGTTPSHVIRELIKEKFKKRLDT
jgi:hypothetical protein